MACIKCGETAPVTSNGMCKFCNTEAKKEALEALKNSTPTQKSMLAGAATGAAIGSVVPIIGTTAGIIVGGIAGFLFGKSSEE